MGSKKAVLIGCNYPGTKAELRGCVNDALRMRECLINRYGLSEEDITLLIDTDDSYPQPTGKNIRRALSDLISSASPGSGDLLFVHYSGHGTRLPAETGEHDDTGYDECIVPTDMNLISGANRLLPLYQTNPNALSDDDFRDLVDRVPDGCYITIVSDSCHSGGLIDEAKEQIGESTRQREKFGFGSVLDSVFGSREEEVRELADGEGYIKNKSLPLSTLIEILQQKTGRDDIDVGKLRVALYDVFGEDASPKVKKFVSVIMSHFDGEIVGVLGNLAHGFLKGKIEENGESYGEAANETRARRKEEAYAGSVNRSLPDNGILISGCQSNQTSADATPSGNPSGAYGALSNAIQTVLSQLDGPVTNKELVLRVREMLKEQGFSQRPGLYCSDETVHSPFLC